MKINIEGNLGIEEFEHLIEMYLKARRNGLTILEIYQENGPGMEYGIVARSVSGHRTVLRGFDED